MIIMERVFNKAKNHKEAEEWDIKQQLSMTPNERKKVAHELKKMLNDFWDSDIPGVKKIEVLMNRGEVFQFGVPPNRIDLLNSIENVEFEEAWNNKKEDKINLS